MASKTEVCNLALGHLGIGKEISNIETDQSSEGKTCRRYFNIVRQIALRDFPWSFATDYRFLSLLATNTEVTAEWAYSYQYPSDCLNVHRIKSGLRQDNRQSRVSYKIVADREILTDARDAEIEYTKDIEDTSKWSADFTMAHSFLLAHYISPTLTQGDPFNIAKKMMELYLFEIEKAKSNAMNENQEDEEPHSEFERVRD